MFGQPVLRAGRKETEPIVCQVICVCFEGVVSWEQINVSQKKTQFFYKLQKSIIAKDKEEGYVEYSKPGKAKKISLPITPVFNKKKDEDRGVKLYLGGDGKQEVGQITEGVMPVK